MIGKSLFIGEQVELTALDSEKDALAISEWTQNLDLGRRLFNGLARQYAVHEVKKKLKDLLKKADDKRTDYYFAIRRKGEGELVGVLRIGWILPTQQVGTLFLDFGDEEKLSAYGSEVMKIALRYAFMELSLHRLGVDVGAENEKAIKLYESMGFTSEVRRRDGVYIDGSYYDQLVFSILKPEWKSIQQEAA